MRDEERAKADAKRERTLICTCFAFAIGSALAFAAMWRVPFTRASPLVFPTPLRMNNHFFSDDVSFATPFKQLVAHLKERHHEENIPAGRLLHRAGLIDGLYGVRTHTPYLLVRYSPSALVRPPNIRREMPIRSRLLQSRRKVNGNAYTIFTHVAPAEERDGGPTSWPPPGDELCVRLLKSGTITSRPWFFEVAADLNRVHGAHVRLRPFGFTVVNTDECRKAIGILAVAQSAVFGLFSAMPFVRRGTTSSS